MDHTTRLAMHRNATAGWSWLPVVEPPPPARHRRSEGVADPSSAATLRRCLGAGALWLLAFGLFALSEGWTGAGILGLAAGAGVVLELLVRQAIRGPHGRASAGEQGRAGGSRSPEWVPTRQT